MIAFFVGENSFEITREIEARVAAFEGEVERVDGEAVSDTDLPNLLMGATLFSPRRLVIIKDLSHNKSVWPLLSDWLPRVSNDTELIIVEAKPDKRTKTYKELTQHATVREFAVWSDRDMGKAERWVIAEAKQLGSEVDKKSAHHLVARVGTDQWRLYSELQKLSALDTITPDAINDLVEANPSENVFNLLATALDGDYKKTTDMIATLRMTEEPYMVFGLLSGQVIQLAALALSDKSSADVARDIGAHPFAVSKLAPYARNLSKAQAKNLIAAFADADTALKTTATEPWLQIEAALLKV